MHMDLTAMVTKVITTNMSMITMMMVGKDDGNDDINDDGNNDVGQRWWWARSSCRRQVAATFLCLWPPDKPPFGNHDDILKEYSCLVWSVFCEIYPARLNRATQFFVDRAFVVLRKCSVIQSLYRRWTLSSPSPRLYGLGGARIFENSIFCIWMFSPLEQWCLILNFNLCCRKVCEGGRRKFSQAKQWNCPEASHSLSCNLSCPLFRAWSPWITMKIMCKFKSIRMLNQIQISKWNSQRSQHSPFPTAHIGQCHSWLCHHIWGSWVNSKISKYFGQAKNKYI